MLPYWRHYSSAGAYNYIKTGKYDITLIEKAK